MYSSLIRKAICFCVGLLGLCASSVVHGYGCPRYWNPRLTNGVKYLVNLQGSLGLHWGDDQPAHRNKGLLSLDATVDARLRLGRFVLGAEGSFDFSLSNDAHTQEAELHLGFDITQRGRAHYKYILSRRHVGTIYGYRRSLRITRTRYCNQTQGYARQHQLTAGPKLYFARGSKGIGGHFNYRFQWVRTRSRTLMFVDVQAMYGALGLFEGTLSHELGGKVRVGWVWGMWSSSLSIQYFAREWALKTSLGLSFWGA